jgi:hypothetical protein
VIPRKLAPWLAAAAVCVAPAVADAGPLSARIGAEPTTVHVGDELSVTLEVERQGAGDVPDPRLPETVLEAFEVGICSPGFARRMSTFGGSQSTETLSCSLTPTKPGKHKLAFSVLDGKTTIRSNVVTVDVLPPTEIEVADPTLDEPTQATGDVFLWASTDKVRAFVGEQITYRLDVYEGIRFLEPQMRTPPSFQDFFAEELPLPDVRVSEIQGRAYRVRPGIRRALFPQRAGTLTIGAAEVAVGRRRNVQSAPIEIEVVPLPAEGQPPHFPPNNVGKYTIQASVDREEVQPGEPLTLTVIVEGSGNIDVLDVGKWPKIPSVRRYDPKVETTRHAGDVVGGIRRFDFLLIPERPGRLGIPPHELQYFDPAAGAYEVAKSEPLSVLVGGDPNAILDEDVEAEADEGGGLTEPLAPVIVLDTVPRRVPEVRWLSEQRWTWGMLAVPLLAAFGLGGGALWRRYGPDEAARTRAVVRRRRRERIEEAQAAATTGAGFHTAVAKLLQEVAIERAGPSGVGLPRPQLCRLLEDRGVASEDCRRLERLLERCDEARFAGERGTAEDREGLLDDALALIRAITKGRDA